MKEIPGCHLAFTRLLFKLDSVFSRLALISGIVLGDRRGALILAISALFCPLKYGRIIHVALPFFFRFPRSYRACFKLSFTQERISGHAVTLSLQRGLLRCALKPTLRTRASVYMHIPRSGSALYGEEARWRTPFGMRDWFPESDSQCSSYEGDVGLILIKLRLCLERDLEKELEPPFSGDLQILRYVSEFAAVSCFGDAEYFKSLMKMITIASYVPPFISVNSRIASINVLKDARELCAFGTGNVQVVNP